MKNFGFRILDCGFAVLLFAVCCLLFTPSANAQGKKGSDEPAAATTPAVTPAMKAEDQLRIRNLQVVQDKKLLEMKALEARYRELQDGVRADQAAIEDAARQAAKNSGASIEKYQVDLDALIFVARPQPTKPSEEKK